MATRIEVRSLSTDALAAVRAAYAKMMSVTDERGYGYHSGIHGLPLPISCRHSPRDQIDYLFLPWHRAYLYFFELALQDQGGPSVGVPWWDWSSPESHSEGLPSAFTDRGSNPLASAVFDWPPDLVASVRQQLPGAISGGRVPRTVREPNVPDELPQKATVDSVLASHTFSDFSTRMENLHGAVHVWVGGTMSQIPTSAYDPIFWSHHTFIDYLWFKWQASGMGQDPPAQILDTVLDPFPVKVGDMLDIQRLGYDYALNVVG